jgi:hypothetical protein
MAEACGFSESNDVIDKPRDMSREECQALEILRTSVRTEAGLFPVIISCWKITPQELEEIKRTGRIWLYVYGHGMPPVAIEGTKPKYVPPVDHKSN